MNFIGRSWSERNVCVHAIDRPHWPEQLRTRKIDRTLESFT